MHWAERIADQLIGRHPDRHTFVVASGISPSGSVHIGNFREIVTTYFVSKALEKHGKQVRFIFSWDDFDRFRKVPAHVDSGYEQYIGMPYTKVPCPYGCHSSYAEHFEQEFEQALTAFGIRPEFIYQSREYQSGRYNSAILHALQHREEIYDIIAAYKTGGASKEERANFYPVHLYCETCGKDATSIQDFDDLKKSLSYSCKCGYQGSVQIAEAVNLKLQWKIDWPMRWSKEMVDFEPGGRDHSSLTGSYKVSAEISEKIFGNPPPMYEPYEFISIKGNQAKMSSSSGNNYTPDDLLKVYAPENILFLFAKYQPNAAFNIGMDEDVLRNYSEFERYCEAYGTGSLTEEIIAALELSLLVCPPPKTPGFSQLASLLPLINFDRNLLMKLINPSGEFPEDEVLATADRAEQWIKQWYPQKLITVNVEPDISLYNSLNNEEKVWIQAFCRLLRSGWDESRLMAEIYGICHHEDKKIMRNHQKRFFTILYQLVINREEGPRIPLLIQAVGIERMLYLLEER